MYSLEIIVSGNIRLVRISVRVPLRVGSNDSGVVDNGHFSAFGRYILGSALEIRPILLWSPFSAFY